MTLTELSFYTRKYYPFAILGVLMILILFYGVQLTFILLKPKQDTTFINPIFHEIKAPIVANASSSAQIKFTLDNIEGRPTTATAAARVYYLLPPPRTPFGYHEKTALMAKSLGFDVDHSSFTQIGRNAIYEDTSKKLKVDIQNFNFNFQYSFAEYPDIFQKTITPSSNDALAKAVDFLQKIDVYPKDLSSGKTNTIYFAYSPDTKIIKPVDPGESANMVEVDLMRGDIDGFPIVSPSFFNSQNYVLMSFFNDGSYQILRSQIMYFEKSNEQYGIYPIRTGDEAYADLQEGGGIVVSNPQNLSKVTIKSMFMAYYDPDQYQDYLQPVYVFLGSNNFVAYVPAVTKQYILPDTKK